MSYTIKAGSRVHTLAPSGSTGLLNPGAAVTIDPDADRLGVTLTVEAIGATPSITWKLQVSLDELNWSDARHAALSLLCAAGCLHGRRSR